MLFRCVFTTYKVVIKFVSQTKQLPQSVQLILVRLWHMKTILERSQTWNRESNDHRLPYISQGVKSNLCFSCWSLINYVLEISSNDC